MKVELFDLKHDENDRNMLRRQLQTDQKINTELRRRKFLFHIFQTMAWFNYVVANHSCHFWNCFSITFLCNKMVIIDWRERRYSKLRYSPCFSSTQLTISLLSNSISNCCCIWISTLSPTNDTASQTVLFLRHLQTSSGFQIEDKHDQIIYKFQS